MIIKEALPFLEADEMREHLQNPEIKVTVQQWCSLIAQSRASLANKAVTLRAIAEKYPLDYEKNFKSPRVLSEQAFRALEETKHIPQGSVFLLTECWIDEDIAWNFDEFFGDLVKRCATPFATFEKAMAYIEEEKCGNEVSDDSCQWYEITRWDLNKDRDLIEAIIWLLGNSGIIWGYCKRVEGSCFRWGDIDFQIGASLGSLNLPVPFKYGDIFTIDMRPIVGVFHAVIIWVGGDSDCCSPTCLYINKCGMMEFSALTHLSFHLPSFSPLLRVERFTGELPEWEAPLKIISEHVKNDHGFYDKLHGLGLVHKERYLTWTDVELLLEQEG